MIAKILTQVQNYPRFIYSMSFGFLLYLIQIFLQRTGIWIWRWQIRNRRRPKIIRPSRQWFWLRTWYRGTWQSIRPERWRFEHERWSGQEQRRVWIRGGPPDQDISSLQWSPLSRLARPSGLLLSNRLRPPHHTSSAGSPRSQQDHVTILGLWSPPPVSHASCTCPPPPGLLVSLLPLVISWSSESLL